MTTNIFTAKYFFNCACRDFGLEDMHTVAIGKILECKESGHLEADYADSLAKLLYNDARKIARVEWEEELDTFGDNEDEAELEELSAEELDEYWDESDESGFDPYMGCYTGDC
jgi:hypothetical protein